MRGQGGNLIGAENRLDLLVIPVTYMLHTCDSAKGKRRTAEHQQVPCQR
jgi:hypothetical protein